MAMKHYAVKVVTTTEDPMLGSGRDTLWLAGAWAGPRAVENAMVIAAGCRYTSALNSPSTVWFEDSADAIAVALYLDELVGPDGTASVHVVTVRVPATQCVASTQERHG